MNQRLRYPDAAGEMRQLAERANLSGNSSVPAEAYGRHDSDIQPKDYGRKPIPAEDATRLSERDSATVVGAAIEATPLRKAIVDRIPIRGAGL